MGNKKWVFWDLIGVIAEFDVDSFYRDIASLFDISIFECIDKIGYERTPRSPFWDDFEREKFSRHAIWQAFCSLFHATVPFYQFVKIFNRSLTIPIQKVVHFEIIARHLNEACVMQALVSNLNTIHREWAEEKLDSVLPAHLIPRDRRFYSCDYGLRKGEEPSLMSAVIHNLRVNPSNACLIDDRVENIDDFHALGGNGILFKAGFMSVAFKLIEMGFCAREHFGSYL